MLILFLGGNTATLKESCFLFAVHPQVKSSLSTSQTHIYARKGFKSFASVQEPDNVQVINLLVTDHSRCMKVARVGGVTKACKLIKEMMDK